MGVVLAPALPALGGYTVGLRSQWATERAQHGIRVISFKTDGVPQRIPDNDPMKDTMTLRVCAKCLRRGHHHGHPGWTATLADVGAQPSWERSVL